MSGDLLSLLPVSFLRNRNERVLLNSQRSSWSNIDTEAP